MILRNHQILLLVTFISLTEVCWSQGDDDGCNEFVCGSVVSKCLLTQSCQCKINDCFCCKDCLNCLGDLFTECCGCLDMCPKYNTTLGAMSQRSEIGDIEGVPELFETLTAEEDEDQWTTMRFAMRAGIKSRFEGLNNQTTNIGNDSINQNSTYEKTPSSVNCTVIYLNSCVRSIKCLKHCESMGSSSYRWFHDGCCQCVGSNCLSYGINESRCTACPVKKEDADIENKEELEDNFDSEENFNGDLDDLDDDMWDYGEDNIMFN